MLLGHAIMIPMIFGHLMTNHMILGHEEKIGILIWFRLLEKNSLIKSYPILIISLRALISLLTSTGSLQAFIAIFGSFNR